MGLMWFLAAFKSPDTDTLVGYYQASIKKVQNYLSTLSSADLDREFDDRWAQVLPTLGSRINAAIREV